MLFRSAANVLDNVPLGINENMYEVLACYERVRRDADVVIPLYDPANFDTHPDGLIA